MIPHNRPSLGSEEQLAAARVLASGWVAQGAEVEAFEAEFCNFLGLPPGHAVAVSSGSAALFLALRVLGAQGKNVALPVYSCAALSNAATLAGAQIRYFDVEENRPNIDTAEIRRENINIVVVAHMLGIPCDFDAMSNASIIEDCAQALGARVDGSPVGLRGKVGVYSFYATKLITAGGQGGMVASSDLALASAVRDYRQFDQRRDRVARFNFQMTDLQAAVGRVQLKRLPDLLARREQIFQRYRSAGIELLDAREPGVVPVRYRAVMRHGRPKELIEALSQRGVSAIVPIEDWELLDAAENYPNAFELSRTTVSLPIHPNLQDAEVDSIVDALSRFLI